MSKNCLNLEVLEGFKDDYEIKKYTENDINSCCYKLGKIRERFVQLKKQFTQNDICQEVNANTFTEI